MKKSELKYMIREVVREEVRGALKEFLTPKKTKNTKKKVTETTSKVYAKDSILNDVLQETAASDEWKTMGDGVYDSSKMNKVLSNQYKNTEDIATSTAAAAGVAPERVPEHLERALNRDYRAVLKATDEKVKRTRNQ